MATGDGKPDSTDLTRNDITQLAIAITTATNMGCDVNWILWVSTAVDKTISGTGQNPSGRRYKGGGSATMEITDRVIFRNQVLV